MDGYVIPRCIKDKVGQQLPVCMQKPAPHDMTCVLVDSGLAREIALPAAETVLGDVDMVDVRE